MTVYVVRHGKAGDRGKWDGPDDLRPLSKPGMRQAEALVEILADAAVEHIVSSPYVRCRQTVEPLALARRLPVDLSDALAEGSSLTETMRLLEKFTTTSAVLCSHGDVIGDLVSHLHDRGVLDGSPRWEKGSTWVLDLDDVGDVVTARFLPPPTI